MRVEKVVSNTGGLPLRIRSGPGAGSDIVGRLSSGDKAVFVEESNGWYKLENGKGWMSGEFLKTTKDLEGTATTTPSGNAPPAEEKKEPVAPSPRSKGLDNLFTQHIKDSNTLKRIDNLDRSVRLFGAPFQHTKQVDFRVNTVNNLGRRYGETIMAEAPVVSFMPCVPDYLPDANKELKNELTAFFLDNENGVGGGDDYGKQGIDSIIKGKGELRYYTTRPAYPAYCRVVNLLCRSLAIFMGIGNVVGPDRKTPLKYYSWEKYKWSNQRFKKEAGKAGSKSVFEKGSDFGGQILEALSYEDAVVRFYVDANTSFSESHSNTTTASKLEGLSEGMEGFAKELSFFIGSSNNAEAHRIHDMLTSGTRNIADSIQSDGIMKRFIGGSADIMRGANMIFPELWSDSNPSRSFNINMTFSSPYGDPLSCYYHSLVPTMHVLGLGVPIQVSPNSYRAPFLVRAFSKGWFECEMGLIESISIERAPDGDWTIDGFPSTIKVSLSITDLYNNLMLTSTHSPILFFKNHGLMNYLAVNGNINMNVPQPKMMVELATALLKAAVVSAPSELGKDFLSNLREKARNIVGWN